MPKRTRIRNVSQQRGRSPKGYQGRGIGGIRNPLKRKPGGGMRGPTSNIFKKR